MFIPSKFKIFASTLVLVSTGSIYFAHAQHTDQPTDWELKTTPANGDSRQICTVRSPRTNDGFFEVRNVYVSALKDREGYHGSTRVTISLPNARTEDLGSVVFKDLAVEVPDKKTWRTDVTFYRKNSRNVYAFNLDEDAADSVAPFARGNTFQLTVPEDTGDGTVEFSLSKSWKKFVNWEKCVRES